MVADIGVTIGQEAVDADDFCDGGVGVGETGIAGFAGAGDSEGQFHETEDGPVNGVSGGVVTGYDIGEEMGGPDAGGYA